MKKRYMLTLTQETFEAVQDDLTFLGLPKAAMSALVDDWLRSFAPTIHHLAESRRRGEQLSFDSLIGDLFNQIGDSMKIDRK